MKYVRIIAGSGMAYRVLVPKTPRGTVRIVDWSGDHGLDTQPDQLTEIRTQTLVLMDYSGEGDLKAVLTKVPWVDRSTGVTAHYRDPDRTVPTHRIVFDIDQIRNTNAHGIGCNAGFVCHIEETA